MRRRIGFNLPHDGDVKRAGVVFYFRHRALRDLWEEEITGQLSDGMWENSWPYGSHMDDWVWVSYAKQVVDTNRPTTIVNLPPYIVKRTGYSKLIPDLGDRMLKIIRRTVPDATMQDLKDACNELSEAVRNDGRGAKPRFLARRTRTATTSRRVTRSSGKLYTTVATFASKSTPGKMYEVKKDQHGVLSCNCPAWINMRSGTRSCPHIRVLAKMSNPRFVIVRRKI